MITQLAVRQAISYKSVNSLKFLSILNKDSDSRFLCLFESASYSSADETTDKFSEAQTQFQSVVSLIQNAQELDSQCRQIIN